MPLCSAFTPYGQLRFSSKQSRLQSIYEGAMAGSDEVYASDGAFAADVYATAREVAALDATLERVNNHHNPLKAVELLSDMEHEYGLAPQPTDTLAQRRAALADRVYLLFGARRDAVESGIIAIVGTAGFVAYYTYPATVTPTPSTPEASPGPNLMAPPGTPVKIYRFAEPVSIGLGSSQTVTATFVGGDTSPLLADERIVVEPGLLGREETVTIENVVGDQITATFHYAHEPNSLARTGCWPHWFSAKRYNVVVVSSEAYENPGVMARLNDFLSRTLRGVSPWFICTESSSRVIGPFNPDEGIPNVTPITELTVV